MYIYNSLSGEKEKINTPKIRPLRLFVCGPTVYDSPHIGHARTEITFDILVRYLRSKKTKVFYLKNITDVDDKIIARAKEQNIGPFELARKYEKEYMEMCKAINVISVDRFARASEFIPQIVRQIETLKKKGYAYEIEEDGWYFDIAQFKNYGKLSRRTTEQAEDAVTRIDENVKKKNRGDFCLWKFVNTKKIEDSGIENGEPFWKTSLGIGRPGWHIEDTAITESFFGPQYDIHGGAVDLKFPHHEAEIAQQEAASGKTPFVRYWMHAGFLLVENRKMSKSLKNFVSIHDFLNHGENQANVLRFMFLNSHYRAPMNFSEAGVIASKNGLETIQMFTEMLEFISEKSEEKKSHIDARRLIQEMQEEFEKAMNDDLNTPNAIGQIFQTLNKLKPDIFHLTQKDALQIALKTRELLSIFGISLPKIEISEKIKKIAEERELCRRNKQFVQSDAFRNEMHGLGYEVSDTPLGPFVRKIS